MKKYTANSKLHPNFYLVCLKTLLAKKVNTEANSKLLK